MDQKGLLTIRTIGIDLALDMLNVAVAAAETDMNVSGFVIIYSSTGMQLCSQVVGPDAKQMAVRIALAKIETVLNRRESTGIWNEKIMAKHTRPENYAGAVKTLFGGGLAIFADEAHTEFVGAIAFSGGEEWQDINICQSAIESVGLYTDQVK